MNLSHVNCSPNQLRLVLFQVVVQRYASALCNADVNAAWASVQCSVCSACVSVRHASAPVSVSVRARVARRGADAGVKSMPVRRWSGDLGLTTQQEQRWWVLPFCILQLLNPSNVQYAPNDFCTTTACVHTCAHNDYRLPYWHDWSRSIKVVFAWCGSLLY